MSEVGEKLSIFLKLVALIATILVCAELASWMGGGSIPIPTAVPSSTSFSFPTSNPAPTNVMVFFPQEITVVDVQGRKIEPVTDVVIRVGNASPLALGEDNRFLVQTCSSGQFIRAWAPGYEINSVPCSSLTPPYSITLNHLDAVDNINYIWSSAINDCNQCHGNQATANLQTGASFDEVNEWFRSGHAKVFTNRYFESMYRGTTVNGILGVPAQPVIIGNEWVPVPPEMNKDYHGPGFRLDFPQEPGNCSYCHAPAAIRGSQESAHLDRPTPAGVSAEGVTCDVCHKVFQVILADNGFPFPDRPGVLSYQFLRPHSDVFMVGPFSNNLSIQNMSSSNHRLTCTPLFSESEFCAPCHFGRFGDMVIYNSYGEWRASPYAANREDPGYRTCQDCHMSHMAVEDTTAIWSQRRACYGGDSRFQDFDHNMMDFGPDARTGKDLPRMVQNAARIDVRLDSEPTGSNALDVLVSVTNMRTGHNFPTDSPLRHLILVVEAEDRVGTPLIQVGGGQIPNWTGPRPGSLASHIDTLQTLGVEDYGGRPGKVFANLLVEEATNLSPGMAYWNETKSAFVDSVSQATGDSRLRPRVADPSTYSFTMPDAGNVKITVKLIYRYAFYDLLLQKEWFDRPDIVVAQVECSGSPRQAEDLTQSCHQTGP